MDVALGVAVTDRVARLALVDSAAPGTVIDQFVLDVAEHPVEVLTETVVGTDRSLAGENHRLVATRLCWPDQAKADELQHALQDSGVHDVAVISEAQAATALVGAAHAGSAVLLVGDETATLSVVGDPDAPPTMVAVAPVAGADATSTVDTLMARLGDQALAPGDVFLVGRSAEHTTVLADQLRAASTMRVQTPDDPTFALARGAAMAAGASGAGEAGVPPTPGEVPGRGTTFCTAGMVPPWNPAVGSSGGGGGTGACCCVGNNGMNFPGWAFWCPSTGFEAAVGRMVTATATASEAKPITAKATTALPISSDRRLNGAERSAAAPYSSCSSYSSTGSSS